MATLQTQRRIRIAADLSRTDEPKDEYANSAPIKHWKANALRIELGLFQGRDTFYTDISALQSVTAEIFDGSGTGTGISAPDDGATPLASVTTDTINSALTKTQWDADTDQHVLLEFTSAQLNQDSGVKWLVISGLTTAGETITITAGRFEIVSWGQSAPGDPPPGAPVYLNIAESDARYYAIRSTITDVSPSLGAYAIDFAATPAYRRLATDADLSLTTTGRVADEGREFWLRIENTGLAEIALTMAEAWEWHSAKPVTIQPGEAIHLHLVSLGAAEADVVASATEVIA